MLSKFADSIGNLVEDYGIKSASVSIIFKGKTYDFSHTEREVNSSSDLLFDIGCAIKPFVATLIMRFVTDGLLDLNESVVTYLPDLVINEKEVPSNIRIRHLLAHSSGIDGYFSAFPFSEDAVQIPSLGGRILFEAGSTYSYSSVGYTILGLIVERIKRDSWQNVVRREILERLHVGKTPEYVEIPARTGQLKIVQKKLFEDGSYSLGKSPAYGGKMNAMQLRSIAEIHLGCNHENKHTELLPEDAKRLMQQSQIGIAGNKSYRGWGLGWMLINTCSLGHYGNIAGKTCCVMVCPRDEWAIACLADSSSGWAIFADAINAIGKETGHDPLRPTAKKGLVKHVNIERLTGKYECASSTIDIAVKNGKMSAVQTDHSAKNTVKMSLKHVSGNEFFAINTSGSLQTESLYFFENMQDGVQHSYLRLGGQVYQRLQANMLGN